MLIGGIEAGGTKMVCGIADAKNGKFEILDRVRFPTAESEAVIPVMIDYFRRLPVRALGIASFGPLDLHRDSPTFGYVKATPKKGWRNTDFAGPFKKALHIPVGFDTDVNGACLGECLYGAGRGLETVAYMTVGTGIGIGFCMDGHPLHGLVHPEAGHMIVIRAEGDRYEGTCRFHLDRSRRCCCLEGLACGPALLGRWGAPGEELGKRKEVWELEAYYLSQGVADIVYFYSPQRVIIGGGVMHQACLFPMIREGARKIINRYVQSEFLEGKIDGYIVPPALGDAAGLAGAFELGRRAFYEE